MTEITLENVSKYFGKVKAVENLNLKIRNKEFMVLLGPSGCGKTTTLRIIAGLESPTSGSLAFDGKDVTDLEPKKRNVAMVFQDYALYPHMSVYDNITLALKVKKVHREEIMERAKRTAEMLGIEELLHRKPSELSGGQKQRVALARAIIRDPSVYLFDEPLSNIDAILRVRMRAELKKLHERLGTTTVYVTHDQVEAMVLADRIALMKDGKLLQVDQPRKIYDHPTTKFAAEFIGTPSMNFVECSLLRKNKEAYLDAGSFRYRIPDKFLNALAQLSGSEVLLGIRPENVRVSTKGKKGDIEAEVYLLQHLGDVGYLTVAVGQHLITAKIDPTLKHKEGEKVYLSFDEDFLHIIDKSTEKVAI
ncbi:MAG: hypothetical protein APU95_01235 [Hadesarchaea archaeon YNP_N21]|jgi:multiple sugar transport system ATP-binding protein|nr:MAG: hypothetical protein APU95_01235 [Hadesarchaea archaeon YNP_N21]